MDPRVEKVTKAQKSYIRAFTMLSVASSDTFLDILATEEKEQQDHVVRTDSVQDTSEIEFDDITESNYDD